MEDHYGNSIQVSSDNSKKDSWAGMWEQMGIDIYGVAKDDMFGSAIAMSRDGLILAVGAQFSGQVFVFQCS